MRQSLDERTQIVCGMEGAPVPVHELRVELERTSLATESGQINQLALAGQMSHWQAGLLRPPRLRHTAWQWLRTVIMRQTGSQTPSYSCLTLLT